MQAGCWLLLIAGTVCSVAEGRPNIVVYLGDDVGVGMVNQHSPEWSFAENADVLGNIKQEKRAHTPTLERMAREGKRFLNSYVGSPVCGPSRHSLLSGVQIGLLSIRGNGFGEDGVSDVDLDSNFTTVAEVLKYAGYKSIAVGKWGAASGADGPGNPCKRGFDYFFGKYSHKEMGHAFPETIQSCTVESSGEITYDSHTYPENVGSSMDRCLDTNVCKYFDWEIRSKAIAMLDDHMTNDSGTPFFLYWATSAGHSSLYEQVQKFQYCSFKTHPMPTFGRYTSQELPGESKEVRGLLAMMELTVDRDMEVLLEVLEEHGHQDNTLILFTSDNGPHREAFADRHYDPIKDVVGTAGLKGIKRNVYEGGLRSPTIAWWPGTIPAGSTSRYPFMLYDIPLTLAQVAGIDASDPILESFQRKHAGGVSVLGVMQASSDETIPSEDMPQREWAAAELCFLRAGRNNRRRVCPVLWSRRLGCVFAFYDLRSWPNNLYKLVQNEARGRVRLYEVYNDPFERRDLSRRLKGKRKELIDLRKTTRSPVCPLEDSYDSSCFESSCNRLKSRRQCSRRQFRNRCTWNPFAEPYNCVDIEKVRSASSCSRFRRPRHCRSQCTWVRAAGNIRCYDKDTIP